VEAPEPPCARRRVLKKSSGALFSELLDSTVFVRFRAAVTHGAPGAALRREAGAGAHGTCAGSRAALSREMGIGAAVTRGAPGAVLRDPGAALSREVRTRATVTHGVLGAALCWEAGAAPGVAPSRSIVGHFW
jgi:hypothetical protein